MSDFIDVQDIAIRNRIAVDGRVNPTVEDWNDLLTHIDRLEQENAELRSVLTKVIGQASHKAAVRHIFEHDDFQWAVDFLNK